MINLARFRVALGIVRKTSDYEIACIQYDAMSAIWRNTLCSKWIEELDEAREKMCLLLREKIEADDVEIQHQRSLRDALILGPIKSVIGAMPGVLQSELVHMPLGDFEMDELRSAIYRAAQSGAIRREKNGRTFRLFLVAEQPSPQ
ncbi:hypothetical protein BA896_021965 [Janthinobacterium lividum]|uniref:Uncharacterized protein n=1 Tax=Janthinobacterium lividum TaxID=29581 RepID=A0A1E8PJB9_9BURK|nr:hypothetical protein BA896_021965 [Janthinobacterium lividum]